MGNRLFERLLTNGVEFGPLALRAPVGPIFAAHGAQKLFGWFGSYGLEGTGPNRGYLMALLAGAAEFLGGLTLMLGLLVRPAAAALAGAMLIAIVAVHLGKGFFLDKGGIAHGMLAMDAFVFVAV